MSYGLSEWGLDYYGTDPRLLLQGGVAVTTHSVVVTLSRGPLARSPLGRGDALNPSTWQVMQVSPAREFVVVGVLALNERRYQLFLRTALPSWNYECQVRTTTLRAASGILLSAPYSVSFKGVVPATTVTEPNGLFDLKNADGWLGGLQTTEAGGYARIFGDEVLKKMIFRRLTTMPGSYFHIPEGEFGQNLKIKEPLRGSSLPALKAAIETEIRREPGVVEVRVNLGLSNGNLSIRAIVQTNSGTMEAELLASR